MNTNPPLDQFSQDAGAYVLGALSVQERHQFELHLRGCPRCAQSVRDLAGLPGLLATVPEAVAEAGPAGPAPDTLLPALIRQVRRGQRRRRWLTAAAAAAAAAVLSVGGLTLAGGPPSGSTDALPPSVTTGTTPAHSTQARSMTVLAPTGLRASLSVQDVAWGSRLELRCTYPTSADMIPPASSVGEQPEYQPPEYQLMLRSTTGRTQRLATWRAVPGKTITITGATSWTRADIADMQVQTTSGQPLLGLTG
ncbi:anti-sigma factor family protein [Leekyejoonella antrihumi]|uniref:Zf-HC2 domain-containing protein n=1 Tax=Leekyejoonella antrihumi TaxID=1660198 RepID=A0A563E453_9MICO|nr:zf-HC2 domain-containing protein [Leekyejoonella antrihumi]TWP37300.1 zf-HC2 domain-containing protein [Leekyejoonella antrihumi]